MIKCPNTDCGLENVDGTQFCEGCGEELAHAVGAVPGTVPTAGPASTEPMIKCPACDNLNPADNYACEVCGAELKPGSAAKAPDPTPATANDPSAALSAPAATPSIDATAVALGAGLTTPIEDIVTAAAVPDAPAVAVAEAADAAADTAAADTAPAGDTVAGAPNEPGTVKLTVEQGMTVGKQFVLGDVHMLVGREDDDEGIYPDIDLSDQDEGYVHRRHAEIDFKDGVLTVTHLGGANKTRVNNKPLADNVPQAVHVGDKIAFGKVVMRLVLLG